MSGVMSDPETSNDANRAAPKNPSNAFIVWCKEHPGQTLTVVGAIIYAAVWAVCNAFYWQFGVRTSEVGLTYDQVLLQAIGLVVLVPMMVVVVLILFSMLLTFVVVPLVTVGGKTLGDKLDSGLASWAKQIYVGLVGLGIVGVLVIGFWSSHTRADLVREGKTVWPGVAWGFVPDPFPVLALPASVQMTKDGTLRSLTYFGSDGRTAVFYDPAEQATIRLPVSSITITVRDDVRTNRQQVVVKPPSG